MNERSYVLITVLVSSLKRRRRRKLISLQKKLRKIKKGCEMEPEPGKLGLIYTVLPQFIRKNRVLPHLPEGGALNFWTNPMLIYIIFFYSFFMADFCEENVVHSGHVINTNSRLVF